MHEGSLTGNCGLKNRFTWTKKKISLQYLKNKKSLFLEKKNLALCEMYRLYIPHLVGRAPSGKKLGEKRHYGNYTGHGRLFFIGKKTKIGRVYYTFGGFMGLLSDLFGNLISKTF